MTPPRPAARSLRASIAIAMIALAGCLGSGRSTPTEPPARTSPIPRPAESGVELTDGPFLSDLDTGLAWLDQRSGVVWRVELASGEPNVRPVQDRPVVEPDVAWAVESFRVLGDDTILISQEQVLQDGVHGTELRTYVPGEPVVAEWFAPGDLAFDGLDRSAVWIAHRGIFDVGSVCLRTDDDTVCVEPPAPDEGVPMTLRAGGDGQAYVIAAGRLFVLADGAWSLIDGVTWPSELLRRGDADLVTTANGEWYVLRGASATLVEDGSHDDVDVFGVGERVIVQRSDADGAGGGPSSFSGFLAGEGSGGVLYWTETVWTEIDLATGVGVELGHESCDAYPDRIGPGCSRTTGPMLVTDSDVWILGRPVRRLSRTPSGL